MSRTVLVRQGLKVRDKIARSARCPKLCFVHTGGDLGQRGKDLGQLSQHRPKSPLVSTKHNLRQNFSQNRFVANYVSSTLAAIWDSAGKIWDSSPRLAFIILIGERYGAAGNGRAQVSALYASSWPKRGGRRTSDGRPNGRPSDVNSSDVHQSSIGRPSDDEGRTDGRQTRRRRRGHRASPICLWYPRSDSPKFKHLLGSFSEPCTEYSNGNRAH